jgi:hypothetical protein
VLLAYHFIGGPQAAGEMVGSTGEDSGIRLANGTGERITPAAGRGSSTAVYAVIRL